MSESLIVDREDALALAQELAERRGSTVDEAVVAALRGTLASTPPRNLEPPKPVPVIPYEEMTPEHRARYDRLTALVEECAPYRVPGATSDYSDMYDEHGLPV
jgi:hypothetical protein